MNIAVYLKDNLKNIPPTLGKTINLIPYSMRPGIGSIYKRRQREIEIMESLSIERKKDFILSRIKPLVCFAYDKVPFYNEYYKKLDFHPDDIRSFEDIQKIPILTKSILNTCPLEDRSYKKGGRYIVNTGGSSGSPFSLYVEPTSMGHEWAHMHKIWEKLGYKQTDLKIVFGGRSDVKNGIEYDVVRNHFAVDIYADYDMILPKLLKIITKYKIKYLHGYPSSIYDFARYCEEKKSDVVMRLKKNLVGAFLGSEYPHKHYRDTIERVFGIKTISWYGHTERAVLAYEKDKLYEYSPFLTYGYTEAVVNSDANYELISTSYYNRASPLIRYNTEDTIQEPESQNGVLTSFKILNGRNGEFVVDKDGKQINLTGLIFGRHHEIFNYTDFIQVKQCEPGAIEIYYVGAISDIEAKGLFDTKKLNFDIRFVKCAEPIRTQSGKINLLLKC